MMTQTFRDLMIFCYNNVSLNGLDGVDKLKNFASKASKALPNSCTFAFTQIMGNKYAVYSGSIFYGVNTVISLRDLLRSRFPNKSRLHESLTINSLTEKAGFRISTRYDLPRTFGKVCSVASHFLYLAEKLRDLKVMKQQYLIPFLPYKNFLSAIGVACSLYSLKKEHDHNEREANKVFSCYPTFKNIIAEIKEKPADDSDLLSA